MIYIAVHGPSMDQVAVSPAASHMAVSHRIPHGHRRHGTARGMLHPQFMNEPTGYATANHGVSHGSLHSPTDPWSMRLGL